MVIGSPATVVSGKRDGAGDHGVEDLVAERLDDPGQDLAAVQRAGVVHRGQNSLKLKSRVKPFLDLLDGVHQQRDTAQGEELALQRDDHAVRGGQRVDREQAERRLAVDEDEVVVGQHRREDPGQGLLAGHLVDQLDLGGRQVDVARQQVHAGDVGLEQDVVDRDVAAPSAGCRW